MSAMVADLPEHQLRNLENFIMTDSFSWAPQRSSADYTYLHNIEPGLDGEAPVELLDVDQSALSFSALKPLAFNTPFAGYASAPTLDATSRSLGLFSKLERPAPLYASEYFEPPTEYGRTDTDSWRFNGCTPPAESQAGVGVTAEAYEYFPSAQCQLSAGISTSFRCPTDSHCLSPTTRVPTRRRSTNSAMSPTSGPARQSVSNSSSCSFHMVESSEQLSVAPAVKAAGKAASSKSTEAAAGVCCQICSEPIDTNSIRKYIRCRKVCNACRTSALVVKGGKDMRFCQLCSWFHDIEKFDGQRHSCRNALAKHNIRRRSKTQVKRRASQD